MGKFVLQAKGFIFFIVDTSLAVLTLILSVVPAKICYKYDADGKKIVWSKNCDVYDNYYGNHGGTGGLLACSIFALIINITWACLQTQQMCQWSALQFGSAPTQYQTGDMIVEERCRVIIPRWGVAIVFALWYFIVAIVAAVWSNDWNVDVWAACAAFSFLAWIVYVGEGIYCFFRTSSYDGE